MLHGVNIPASAASDGPKTLVIGFGGNAWNGEDVASMNCDEFDKPGLTPDGQKHKYVLNGKPRAIKDFARSGYLGFQDHGHKVWYKNVKLLPLVAKK